MPPHNYHQATAEVYDLSYEGSRTAANFVRKVQQALDEVSTWVQPPARIIDFGSGTGRLTIPLAAMGYTLTAVDVSQAMLAQLAQKARSAQLTVQIHHTAIDTYLAKEDHDLAICVFTVIAYILDESCLSRSIANMAKSLRSGGKLIIEIPVREIFDLTFHDQNKMMSKFLAFHPYGADIFSVYHSIKLKHPHPRKYAEQFQLRYWPEDLVFRLLHKHGLVLDRELKHLEGSNFFLFAKP